MGHVILTQAQSSHVGWLCADMWSSMHLSILIIYNVDCLIILLNVNWLLIIHLCCPSSLLAGSYMNYYINCRSYGYSLTVEPWVPSPVRCYTYYNSWEMLPGSLHMCENVTIIEWIITIIWKQFHIVWYVQLLLLAIAS